MATATATKLYTDIEVKDVDVEARTAIFTINTDLVDRDREILLPTGCDLENYNANPVVLWSHGYDSQRGTMPIGRSQWVKPQKKMIPAKVEFAEDEFSSQVMALVKGGFLNAASIGFNPRNWVTPTPEQIRRKPAWAEAQRVCDDWELLEWSICAVPSNPGTLARAIADKSITLSDELVEHLGIPAEIDKLERAFEESDGEDEAADAVKLASVMERLGDIEGAIGLLLEPTDTKPLPNEHACRLRDPGDFQDDSFRRVSRQHDSKKYTVIMAKLTGETTMTEQAYRYGKDVWTASEARTHCKDHDGTFEASRSAYPVVPVVPLDRKRIEPVVIAQTPVREKPKSVTYADVTEIVELEIGRRRGRVSDNGN